MNLSTARYKLATISYIERNTRLLMVEAFIGFYAIECDCNFSFGISIFHVAIKCVGWYTRISFHFQCALYFGAKYCQYTAGFFPALFTAVWDESNTVYAYFEFRFNNIIEQSSGRPFCVHAYPFSSLLRSFASFERASIRDKEKDRKTASDTMNIRVGIPFSRHFTTAMLSRRARNWILHETCSKQHQESDRLLRIRAIPREAIANENNIVTRWA